MTLAVIFFTSSTVDWNVPVFPTFRAHTTSSSKIGSSLRLCDCGLAPLSSANNSFMYSFERFKILSFSIRMEPSCASMQLETV